MWSFTIIRITIKEDAESLIYGKYTVNLKSVTFYF